MINKKQDTSFSIMAYLRNLWLW